VKIAYYCQHVLGIGHFHRSLEICKALAGHHQVTLIIGGPDVEPVPENIKLFKLPGLQMDSEFKNLAPCDPDTTLTEVKETRQRQLYEFFESFKPDAFLVELYPFGRKAFRFELDPVLTAIRDGVLFPCKCYVSLRDILVERATDREKFESRALSALNRYFDGLLIHSDENIITLDETFSRYTEIAVPIFYTGFVTRTASNSKREEIRSSHKLRPEEKLIVASIGGGNVGADLLEAVVEAFRIIVDSGPFHLQLFSGPYFPEEKYLHIENSLPANASLDRFTDSFPDWLAAADLSISMAGYNTCMNIIQAGIPALVYPFAQNREQEFRARRLQKKAAIKILSHKDLQTKLLASTMLEMCRMERYPVAINLHGAEKSRQQVEIWNSIF
jgi:predicted glycosyltransferase